MNILQLISSNGFFGAENVVANLSRGLADLGHTSYVGVISPPDVPGWPVEAQGLFPLRYFRGQGRMSLGLIAGIRDFIVRNGIKVVNSHNYKADVYAYTACCGIPIRRIATCHNWISRSAKMRAYEAIDKLFLRGFDAVIPVSRMLKEELMACGIHENRIRVIANGINGDGFSNVSERESARRKAAEGIGISERVILSVGRLSAEKGHAILLAAFSSVVKAIPNARLVLVGDGPERMKLVAEAGRLGVAGKVVFAGFRKDASALPMIADLFVLPSLMEGMPLALMEAMACGVPVVATRVGAVSELTGSNEYGLLVEPGDPEALRQAILSVFAAPEQARGRAINAQSRIRNEYSSRRMAREYAEIYQYGAYQR